MAEGIRRATRQRHDELLRLLRAGIGSVEELAARTGTSPSTVRRDLARLTQGGRVARTYGGALVADAFHERSVGESAGLRQEAKEAVARQALGLVPTAGTIFLDAGTTCARLADLLRDRSDLVVVTRGLESAVGLSVEGGPEVVLLGGRVRPMSHGLVGPLTDLALDRLSLDVAFVGADGVDPERGVGEPTIEETTVKERVAARARRVVVLADSSKLAAPPLPAWTRLPPGWSLVTDDEVTENELAAFARAGVEVSVAPTGAAPSGTTP